MYVSEAILQRIGKQYGLQAVSGVNVGMLYVSTRLRVYDLDRWRTRHIILPRTLVCCCLPQATS
jgi:hypothetical protein